MWNRSLPEKSKGTMEYVRETTLDKSESSTGCVRETPQIKMMPARDV